MLYTKNGNLYLKPEYVAGYVRLGGEDNHPIFKQTLLKNSNTPIDKLTKINSDEVGVEDNNIKKLDDDFDSNVIGNERLYKANKMFENLLGEQLSSWIPSVESGGKMMSDLLDACDKAQVKIDDKEIKQSIKVLNAMQDYYKKARDNLDIKIDDTFDTYRTHGIVHGFGCIYSKS